MAKSVRYSWAHGHNPLWIRIGIFVETKAVIIIIISGMEATRVISPIMIRNPQIISKEPVKYAQNAGWLNPIVKNLPVPKSSGNKYFCIPSVRNIKPTVNLIRIALLLFSVLKICLLNQFFVFMVAIISLFFCSFSILYVRIKYNKQQELLFKHSLSLKSWCHQFNEPTLNDLFCTSKPLVLYVIFKKSSGSKYQHIQIYLL